MVVFPLDCARSEVSYISSQFKEAPEPEMRWNGNFREIFPFFNFVNDPTATPPKVCFINESIYGQRHILLHFRGRGPTSG